MTIIAIANSKGGVGKSTIAVHLAARLAKQGHRVTLADCDAQRSSSQWIAEAARGIKLVRLESTDQIIDELPLLGQVADFVVADGPGSNTDTSRALLFRADLAIATDVVRQTESVRCGPPKVVMILNVVGKNYRLTSDMKDAAVALHFPMASVPMILKLAETIFPNYKSLQSLNFFLDILLRTVSTSVFLHVTPFQLEPRKMTNTNARLFYFVFSIFISGIFSTVSFGQSHEASISSTHQYVDEFESNIFGSASSHLKATGVIYCQNNIPGSHVFSITYQWDGEDAVTETLTVNGNGGYNSFYLDASTIAGGGWPVIPSRTCTVTITCNGQPVMNAEVFEFYSPLPPEEEEEEDA